MTLIIYMDVGEYKSLAEQLQLVKPKGGFISPLKSYKGDNQ